MPDNNEVKSKRQIALERMQKKYPERNFDNDEDFYGQINDEFDDYDRRISESETREKAFSDMFTSDPRSARLMMEWKNGADPAVALLQIYGNDILEAVDDPERQEAIKQSNIEFAEKVAKEKEYEETYDRNIKESLENLESWAGNNGISDDEVDSIMERLTAICRDFLMGKFTSDTLDMMRKAQNYDMDIEQAQAEGEVAGRNARIEEKLRKGKKGDGTVALNGRSGAGRQSPKRDLGALERFDNNDSIWERGGEKRIPRR